MRLHEIYTLDSDEPVVVKRLSQLGPGIQYTDDEGCSVLVPWSQVVRVVGRRVADELPADVEAEPAAVAEAEPATTEPEPVTPDADPAAGKASEWAETDPAAVREWAQAQGLAVADSGPISKSVLTKYAAAHSD